jgi:imidazolonepropionase
MCGTAAKMGAVSIDHLDHISEQELKIMGQQECVGVLLPGVPFFLQTGVFPDVRRFKEAGVPFAIATDFNPGSCPSYSMPMMIALAVLKCHATVEEAIMASTFNAACALKLGSSIGSLNPGKQADILILDLEDYHEIPYYFGTNPVHSVWKDGVKVV